MIIVFCRNYRRILCRSDPGTPSVLCWNLPLGSYLWTKAKSSQGLQGLHPHFPLLTPSQPHQAHSCLRALYWLFPNLEGSYPTPRPSSPRQRLFHLFQAFVQVTSSQWNFLWSTPFQTAFPAFLPSLLTLYILVMDWSISPPLTPDSYVKTLTPNVFGGGAFGGWSGLEEVIIGLLPLYEEEETRVFTLSTM